MTATERVMRNRSFRTIAFCTAAVMLMCSCGTSAVPGEQTEQPSDQVQETAPGTDSKATDTADTVQTETVQNGAGEETKNADTPDTEAAETVQVQGEGEYLLYDETYKNAYMIDSAGNKLAYYDISELAGLLPGGEYSNYFQTAGDGLLYYSTYVNVDDKSLYRICAVDPERRETAVVWTAGEEWYDESVDLYDGKLHVTYSKDNAKGEAILVREPGKLVFTEENNDLADFFEATKGYSLYGTAREPVHYYDRCCYERVFDECGFVIGNDYENKKWYMISRDGKMSDITAMSGKNVIMEHFDADYLIYTELKEDYSAGDSFVMSVDTFGTRKTDLRSDDSSLVAFRDGCMYYSVDKGQEYNVRDDHIYRYSCADDMKSELYSVKSVPGAMLVTPGIQGLRLIGDRIYFAGVSGDKLDWFYVDAKKGGDPVDAGLKISDIDVFRYGTVDYRSESEKCDYCGTMLSQTYCETLRLDQSWSAHADKINDYLEQMMNGDFVTDEEYEQTDENCDEHREYPQMWNTTKESHIDKVSVLFDRYLAIDISGYWYGGGAHGYPIRGQHIFDLQSGECLKTKDFFAGSEEDFKKIIAEKTKEDYKRQEKENQYPQYFAESADEVYDQAYENASLDTLSIEYSEDGALIVYSPYEMGAYASGYIEVPVSYRELFGRDSL